MILGGIFLNLCVMGALMRPPPSQASSSSSKKTKEQPMTSEESDPLTGEQTETDEENKQLETEKENSLLNLAKNLPFVVYCLSQMVFIAGFLTGQLYIVPFAQREVSAAINFMTLQHTGNGSFCEHEF